LGLILGCWTPVWAILLHFVAAIRLLLLLPLSPFLQCPVMPCFLSVSLNPSPDTFLEFVKAVRVHKFIVKSANILLFMISQVPSIWLILSSSLWCNNALLIPFGAVLLHVMINGRPFVVITFLSRHLLSCSGDFYLWLVWHISLFLSSLKSPTQGSSSRSRRTGLWRLVVFVDVLVCEGNTLLWRRLSTSTCSKSCTLRRYQDFRLGCIFFMFLLTLVLSVNSPNATSLHSRCIWEGVLEYNSQG